jgi:hypothetical protein
MTISLVEYVYWIGSDPFTPSGDVWRSSDGGLTWTKISTAAPTSGLVGMAYGVLAGNIYFVGGQDDIGDSGTAVQSVYRSTDNGVTWTQLTDAPWDAGHCFQLGPMPVKDGKLWLVAGAKYHSTSPANFFNDVWSFDGSSWVEVLADGHSDFPKCRYHCVVVDPDGALWRIGGTTSDGVTVTSDSLSAHYSTDGATWVAAGANLLPWQADHAQAVIATSDGIYLTDGYHSTKLFVIQSHTAALASAWGDIGSANLDLAQATDAKKPIAKAAMLGAQVGLVFTTGQLLALAAPDRSRSGGRFEAWFVGRTLNFATLPAVQSNNPPAGVIGAKNGSNWNGFGFDAGELNYIQYTAGYQTHKRGSGFNDDDCRLYGISHADNDIKFYAGATQQGATITDQDFDPDWTGWDNVGAGYLEDDKGEFVLGAVVVLPNSAASDATSRTKLANWARKWGAPAP